MKLDHTSHHLLRRRARAAKRRWEKNTAAFAGAPVYTAVVERSERGPWRWRCDCYIGRLGDA